MQQAEQKTYYDLLGVERDAPVDRIKQAYVELARIYHPDSNYYTEIVETGLDAETLRKFQELTNAYNTLVHAKSRQAYDATLMPNLPSWENGTGSDAFHGGRRGSGVSRMSEGKRPSEAYGIFGQASNRRNSDPILEKQMDMQSEIIRRGVRVGFWRRFLLALGLGFRV